MTAPARIDEDPTEELPVETAPSRPSSSYAEWILEKQIAIDRLTRAVESHRRAARSGSVAITAADRRLYERVERLRRPPN